MNDLAKRLREHAAVHDACTSSHSDEQMQWADDLREAADIVELASVAVNSSPFQEQIFAMRDLRAALEGATNANT